MGHLNSRIPDHIHPVSLPPPWPAREHESLPLRFRTCANQRLAGEEIRSTCGLPNGYAFRSPSVSHSRPALLTEPPRGPYRRDANQRAPESRAEVNETRDPYFAPRPICFPCRCRRPDSQTDKGPPGPIKSGLQKIHRPRFFPRLGTSAFYGWAVFNISIIIEMSASTRTLAT